MAFKSIKDEIVTTLDGVSSLEYVYGKEEKVLEGYPAACISGDGYAGQFQTMGVGGANKETYQHVIRIYFRTDENNDPDYEDVLEGVADDVLTALRHNVTLNGTCDYALPVSGRWIFGEKESPVRVFEIIESATVYATR